MKSIVILTLILISLSCAKLKKVTIEEGAEYWSEGIAGDTTTLMDEYHLYAQGADTLLEFTNYYENGQLKSKVVMRNELLSEIQLVLDTLGRKLDFGQFKNGTGYVVEFRDDGLGPNEEGQYIDGNREGWWKIYHYTGYIYDSLFYVEGVPQYPSPSNSLDSLLDFFGPMKNNLYR